MMAKSKNAPKDKKPVSGAENGSKEEGSYDRASLENTENGAFRKPVNPGDKANQASPTSRGNENDEEPDAAAPELEGSKDDPDEDIEETSDEETDDNNQESEEEEGEYEDDDEGSENEEQEEDEQDDEEDDTNSR